MKKLLSGVTRYMIFFLLVAFLVTCCVMLFTTLLTENLNIVLDEDKLDTAARLTFLNVIALSLLYMLIDALRRKLTVERSARKITEAAKKMIEGDFSVRVTGISRLAMEEGFSEIAECFNRMAEELSGVETLRTDFISNVSHEMKTPLSAIANYGTLLQAPALSDEKRIEYAKGITNGSRRLSDMITNILRLNRLENQQIFPNKEKFDLGEQLCEALIQFENAWEEKNIEIETDIAEEISVLQDKELLMLVWNNLLSNAFKFTPSGGSVGLTLKTEGEYALVAVKDTGLGMSRETGKHIFEKFYQGDTSHATSGNGLGLALVKRIIDIVNGEINVESAPGKGTTFFVKIRTEK